MVKPNWTIIAWLVIGVMGTVILMSVFGGSKKVIDKDGEIKLRDEIIQTIREDRDYYRSKYDSVIAAATTRNEDLKNQYKNTVIKYEKVPVIINDYDREQLRRAVTNF